MTQTWPHIYGRELTDEEIAHKAHRDFVGGYWEAIGGLQFEFLRDQGLRPGDRLLDVGCGALRGGVYFIRYLDRGGYYGIDMNASLIRAGREVELAEAGLAARPVHLLVNERFEFERFGTTFRFAIAQSLFTHLALNAIERCLVKIAGVLEPGGRFFATYFEAPTPHHLEPLEHEGGTITQPDADPFHYHPSTFEFLIRGLPLSVRNLGPWNHPRSQHMLEFTRDQSQSKSMPVVS